MDITDLEKAHVGGILSPPSITTMSPGTSSRAGMRRWSPVAQYQAFLHHHVAQRVQRPSALPSWTKPSTG